MQHVYDDGGREVAGFTGHTGDCGARAFAIASGRSYQEVYDLINELAAKERTGKRKRSKSSARSGLYSATAHKLAYELQWRDGQYLGTVKWMSCMNIGSGCKVHLTDGELPMGRLVVRVSKHYTAVIDGVIHDTHDPQREGGTFHWHNAEGNIVRAAQSGGRCVYGYWVWPSSATI
jgi:hypothetical protein